MINAFEFTESACFTIDLKRLSAFSVTEHVLITYISADSEKSTFSKPLDSKSLAIVDVSEKFNLHPNVWNATFLVVIILVFLQKRQIYNEPS
jgi:hypothetical protein